MLISSKHKCFALRYGEFKLLLANTYADECRPMLNAIWFNLARQQIGVTTGTLALLAQVGTLEADAPSGRNVFLERVFAAKAVKAANRKSWIVVHVGGDTLELSVRTTRKRHDTSDDPFLTVAQMLDGTTADGSIDTRGNGADDNYPRSYPVLERLISERERATVTHSKHPVAFGPYQLRVLTQLGEVCDDLHIAIHGDSDGMFARGMARDDSDTLWTTIVMPMRNLPSPRSRQHTAAPKKKGRKKAA